MFSSRNILTVLLSVAVPALFLLLGTVEGFADIAPVKSVGKAIQPLRDVPVQMVSEDVEISLFSTMVWVDCLFTPRNEGKTDTIEVGFPRGWEGDLMEFRAKNASITGVYTVETIAQDPAWDGEDRRGELPWWKVFKVPFESTDQTVKVKNSYGTYLRPREPKYLDDLAFTYIMKTGALWKGNIEDARVTISLRNVPFDQVTSISPEGYTREGNDIIWRFQNFKPDRDIEISIMQDILYERLTIARKILEKEPGNAYAHFLLGTVFFNRDFPTDHNKTAEKEFQQAISLDPNLSDARWFLAIIYVYRNMKTKALKDAKTQLDAILKGNPEYRCMDKTYQMDNLIHTDTPNVMIKNLTMNGWK